MKPIGEIMKNITIPRPASGNDTPRSSESADDACPICKGAGYVRIDAPVGTPNFSRLMPCTCRLEDRWSRHSNDLGDFGDAAAIGEMTFDSFDASEPGAREPFEIAREYARNPSDWIIFVGEYGCGKTHLAAAIANYAREELQMRPVFAVVPDLLDYLRSAFAPNSESTYERRFEAIRSADLLLLDDLGTENTTTWAREKLFQIVNYRYLERLPTIVTTNVDWERIEGRIRSRLFDRHLAEVVYIDSEDYRIKDVSFKRRRRK